MEFDPPADFSHYDGIAFEYRCHVEDDSTVVRPQPIEQGGWLYHIMSDWKATQAWTTRQFPFSDMDWASFSAADANGKLDLDKILSLRLLRADRGEDNTPGASGIHARSAGRLLLHRRRTPCLLHRLPGEEVDVHRAAHLLHP